MNKTIWIIIAVIVVVIGTWWILSATVPSGAIAVSGSEFKYEPSIISATVGQPVTVTYTNTGAYPHDFVIDELSVQSPTIQPGQTETFSFTPDQVGDFSFYCSLPTHRDKGMVGTISVK